MYLEFVLDGSSTSYDRLDQHVVKETGNLLDPITYEETTSSVIIMSFLSLLREDKSNG